VVLRRLAPLLFLATSCSSAPVEPGFEPECTVNQFRACETDSCRGAQQCVGPGLWDRCFCTVLDASGPPPEDATTEAASDAGPD